MRTPHPEKRFGFTLVEMLVVIAIIGILAAILVPTVASALTKAKNAAMALEIKNLANAITEYKNKFNDYPPDFSSLAAVQAHVRKAFPRATHDMNPASTTGWYDAPPWASATNTQDPRDLDEAEALVFWLSAVSSNPRTPLYVDLKSPNPSVGKGSIDGPGEAVSLFDFDETRLTDLDNDGWPEYVPKQAPNAPYVYFDGRLYAGKYIYDGSGYSVTGVGGVARPYRTNQAIDTLDNGKTQPQVAPNTTTWVNAGAFQIFCAGLDEDYGPDLLSASSLFKQYPDPNYSVSDEDMDNLADFTGGQTIGESVP